MWKFMMIYFQQNELLHMHFSKIDFEKSFFKDYDLVV